MPFPVGGNSRIRTNIAAENAYNALEYSNRDISLRQLRLATGKRINNAADDVAAYITSRALLARNSSLRAAERACGDAKNVCYIMMDSLENISTLILNIKEATSNATSGAQGTDERVALAKAAYRMAEQVQTVVDSTVFGGRQLIDGTFSADFVIGTNAVNALITLGVDMTLGNPDFDIDSNNFNINSKRTQNFAGITGFDLNKFYDVESSSLGVFADGQIHLTLVSIADALENVNKVAAYLGGVVNRLTSQEDTLKSQLTNYNSAISRIEDADVAREQLELVKSQFLQQASLISLTQSNMNPQSYLNLIQSGA